MLLLKLKSIYSLIYKYMYQEYPYIGNQFPVRVLRDPN